MTFPERTRSECAVLACCGVMVPETSLRLQVQINWWNPPLILLGQFFRWSVRSNLRAKPPLDGGSVQASLYVADVPVAKGRRASRIVRLERVAGHSIIAPQRSSSAHLHRPWRAIIRFCTISLPGI